MPVYRVVAMAFYTRSLRLCRSGVSLKLGTLYGALTVLEKEGGAAEDIDDGWEEVGRSFSVYSVAIIAAVTTFFFLSRNYA